MVGQEMVKINREIKADIVKFADDAEFIGGLNKIFEGQRNSNVIHRVALNQKSVKPRYGLNFLLPAKRADPGANHPNDK